MRKEIWMHTQTNLSESLEKQEYTTLIQYASDNKEYVINEWYNSDNSSLSQILRYGNSQLNYFEHHLPTASKEDAIFQLGTLMGVIKTFKDFLHEKQQENLTAQIYQKQVLSVKHLKSAVNLWRNLCKGNHIGLSVRVIGDDLLHPDHIVPTPELVSAFVKFSYHGIPQMLMKLNAVMV